MLLKSWQKALLCLVTIGLLCSMITNQSVATNSGTPSSTQTEESLSGYPWGSSAMPFLPQDAREFRVHLFNGYARNYVVICYTHYITTDANEYLGADSLFHRLCDQYESEGLMVGYLCDNQFILLFHKKMENNSIGLMGTKNMEFGTLRAGNHFIDVMFANGYTRSCEGMGTFYSVWGFDLSSEMANAAELNWSSNVLGEWKYEYDFKLVPELNGLVGWQHNNDTEWTESPFSIIQILYTLDQSCDGTMVERRREITERIFEEFPDEPPIAWW